MRTLSLTFIALTLSGCANWGFDSNVSPAGVKDYYKGSGVSLYTREQLANSNYVTLGSVEGEACQLEANEPPPSEADARKDIRRRAADMGANGLLLDRCVHFDNMPGCIEHVLCSGQALSVAK